MTTPDRDPGLDAFDLHRQTPFVDEAGRRGKFVVARPDAAPERPRGPSSPTLPAPDGERMVGFDNARPVGERPDPGGRKRRESDHRRRPRSIGARDRKDAATTLGDFRNEVDAVPKERGSVP